MLVINETSHSKDLQYRAASQYFSKQILHNATLASHLVVVRCIHTVYPCCIHKTHTDTVETCHLSIHFNITVSVNGFSSSKSSDLFHPKPNIFLFVCFDRLFLVEISVRRYFRAQTRSTWSHLKYLKSFNFHYRFNCRARNHLYSLNHDHNLYGLFHLQRLPHKDTQWRKLLSFTLHWNSVASQSGLS